MVGSVGTFYLLAEGKAVAAKEAMQHALAAKSEGPNIRWPPVQFRSPPYSVVP